RIKPEIPHWKDEGVAQEKFVPLDEHENPPRHCPACPALTMEWGTGALRLRPSVIPLVEDAQARIAVLAGGAGDLEVVGDVEIDRHLALAIGAGGDAQIDVVVEIGAGLD